MNAEVALFEKLSGIYDEIRRKNEENCSYNVFSVMNVERLEVSTHSKIIYSLLDKDGEHKMGDKYLKLFIENIGFGEWLNIESTWTCISEYRSREMKCSRPDFIIKSDQHCILIEMKIDAGDGDRQIARYFELLESEFMDIEEPIICYLTPTGRKPSYQSAEDLDVELLSFKEHIRNWLDACIKITDEKKSVYSGLQQYRGLIEKLVQEDSGLNEMVDLLGAERNIETLHNIREIFYKIEEAEEELKKQTLVRFFGQLEKHLLPSGFERLEGNLDYYIGANCKYVSPCEYRFQKSRGIGYYLLSDYTCKPRKSKQKYKIELIVSLENKIDDSILWYGFMLWNDAGNCYATDEEHESVFTEPRFVESDLLLEDCTYNYFTSEIDGEKYCFSELSAPVVDMFTDEGLSRQVKRVIREIQKVIDIFDKDGKYQIDISV